MNEAITIGIDLAKNVFQVHGVAADGTVVIRRQLRRGQMLSFFEKQPPCLIGMEACATSHHWARELVRLGHEARLMPPRYVKPYVKRNKNDMADAEAICEAVTRPTMRFVAIKTAEQQSVLILHKSRQLFVRQRTTLINAILVISPSSASSPASGATGWRSCLMSSSVARMTGCRKARVSVCWPCAISSRW